jgi:hypothetical protein
MTMLGQAGWLYYGNDGMVENYTGKARFEEKDLRDWQKLLEGRRDWLGQLGGKYIFVVAPNKETMYPEYLPKWVAKTGQPVKLDQFLAYMRQHSTVSVLDLRPKLIAAKNQGATYFQTDTHWNSFGAFVAYQELINALQIPGIKPLDLDCFSRTPTRAPGGDLAICIEQEKEMMEKNGVSFCPKEPLKRLKKHPAADRELWGIVTENPEKCGKVVIFRDSFAEAWVPFIGYHFNQVIYRGQHQWDRPLLQREKPDIVIDEIVEPNFNNLAPLQLLQADTHASVIIAEITSK